MITVFVSSTWKDLQPERKAVEKAIHRIREIRFNSMEYFGSRANASRDVSLDEVDQSDFYIGIFGERYGSGITEDEYRRAREQDLPCHIYFKDKTKVTPDQIETDPKNIVRLVALKKELRQNHVHTKEFSTPDGLATDVVADLHRWLMENYLPQRLEKAAQGTLSTDEAQKLVGDVRDWNGFAPELLARLRAAGFNINTVSNTGGITVGGNVSGGVLNTGNIGNITNNG